MALQPEALYTEQPGLKPIKEVGLFENYGPVIPVQHHEETCPYPSLESWIIVKKLYPIGTLIKKEFDGTMYVGEVTDIEPQKRIYTIHYKEDNTTEEMGTKQIKKYLHKDEMKKYPIGTKIAKQFQSSWFYGEIVSINVEDRFFKVKYDDNDWEELTLVEVKKYLDTGNKRKR